MNTYIELSVQARSQESFTAGNFLGIKILWSTFHLLHTKEKPIREKSKSVLLLDISNIRF